MIDKYICGLMFVALLYVNTAVGDNQLDRDEIDTSTMNQSGCKFVSLTQDQSVEFSLNSSTFANVRLVPAGAGAAATVDRFTLHFAVRTDADLELTLLSKTQYDTDPSDPDYKLELGTAGGEFLHATLPPRWADDGRQVLERYSPGLLALDKYTKLYIAIDKETFKLGVECEPFPSLRLESYKLPRQVVQLGFKSRSPRGARLLFDCPAEFAGCTCW